MIVGRRDAAPTSRRGFGRHPLWVFEVPIRADSAGGSLREAHGTCAIYHETVRRIG